MISRTLGLASGVCIASSAIGAITFQVDVNGLRANTGTGAYNGATHSGTITITLDSNSVLAGILIDGQSMNFTSSLATFSASITLVNGAVTGGNYRVIMSDSSRYLANILPASGATNSQAGQGFMISGLTYSGVFSNLVGGTHFGGIDVTEFSGKTLDGSLMLTAFAPSAGIDPNVNFEGFATIPAPGAGAAIAFGALACLRRRR